MFKAAFALLLATVLPALAQQSLSLAGEWKFTLDEKDLGLTAGPETWNFPDTIQLPGTTAAQGKGTPLDIELNLQKPAMQHLHQKHSYIGPAWYQREVTVPQDWAGKDYQLTLERVLWESRVWIDGKPVGEPQNSVSVPHRYDLSSLLVPGKTHQLTLRIDNRQQVDIGTIGHAYTQETQSIWNGVIGELKIEALPKLRVSHLKPSFDATKQVVNVTIEITNATKQTRKDTVGLSLLSDQSGAIYGKTTKELTFPVGTSTHEVTLPCGGIEPWSEFNPTVWNLNATLNGLTHTVPYTPITFEAKDRDLLVNGQPTFLRGNLECAIFPQTGHPDASGEQWEKIMKTSREYGLNHLRFHSWCPPEAAFAAADRHGIYLQVELPNWTFEMGRLPKTDEFFRAEGARIFREYGHHPSFVMFSLGNELKGKLTFMDNLIKEFRALAPDVLFTSTTYAFSPRGLLPGPQDDFFISQRTKSGWVRGQGFLNSTFPSTNTDYAEGLSCLEIPLVTHEVGQYVVYPNLAEMPKYHQTPMRPTALESIEQDLKAKGLLEEAANFTRDSGKLAALLYKEDIERALRTDGLSGIQLLQLQDFPGQSTASVGLLDAFWDSKGLISPAEFRQFNSPVVPLAKMDKFVWENSETFTAELEVANFGPGPLARGHFVAELIDKDGALVASQTFDRKAYRLGNGQPIGTFSTPLAPVTAAAKLTLQVRHHDNPEIKNTWPIWVYPQTPDPLRGSPFVTHRALDEACRTDLAAGKRVILLPVAGAIKKALPARFIPVFWSPLHFPNQPGTLGATISTEHPLWENFPTDTHTNWQWWELTANSTAVDLTGLPHEINAPFRFVDKYNRNARPVGIFEAKVGPGQLLVCTLDLKAEGQNGRGIVARQLERALYQYLASDKFAPEVAITPEQLGALFGERGLVITATASQSGYGPDLANDDNPNTIWHSPWTGDAKLPVALELDLLSEKVVSGLEYLPRQDQTNGLIKDYQIQVSRDGKSWQNLGKKGTFPRSSDERDLKFAKPVKLRYVRLVALSEHNGNRFAACAELKPVIAPVGDARDLGIIPGFNDN